MFLLRLRSRVAPLPVNFLEGVELLVESLKSFLHFAYFRRQTSNPVFPLLGFDLHPSDLFLFFCVLCFPKFLIEFMRGLYFGSHTPDEFVLFCTVGLQLVELDLKL